MARLSNQTGSGVIFIPGRLPANSGITRPPMITTSTVSIHAAPQCTMASTVKAPASRNPARNASCRRGDGTGYRVGCSAFHVTGHRVGKARAERVTHVLCWENRVPDWRYQCGLSPLPNPMAREHMHLVAHSINMNALKPSTVARSYYVPGLRQRPSSEPQPAGRAP